MERFHGPYERSHGGVPARALTKAEGVIGDDHRKVAEQLGEFFAQVSANLSKCPASAGNGESVRPLR